MEKNNQHNNHGGGFLFGLITGVILTLMLTTKKGRRILKVLTEEGFDKLSEWDDIVKDVTDALDDDDEYVDDEGYVEDEREKEPEERRSSDVEEEKPERKSSRARTAAKRLFRGVKKRS